MCDALFTCLLIFFLLVFIQILKETLHFTLPFHEFGLVLSLHIFLTYVWFQIQGRAMASLNFIMWGKSFLKNYYSWDSQTWVVYLKLNDNVVKTYKFVCLKLDMCLNKLSYCII
jgi:hypothetical protein